MLKGLCITALTIASIVFLIFVADLAMGFLGMADSAPFQSSSILMDIIFMVCSGTTAVLSWFTFREQR